MVEFSRFWLFTQPLKNSSIKVNIVTFSNSNSLIILNYIGKEEDY